MPRFGGAMPGATDAQMISVQRLGGVDLLRLLQLSLDISPTQCVLSVFAQNYSLCALRDIQ